MTKKISLNDVETMDEFLTPAIVAAVLGCDPQIIRIQARENRDKLGFPVIVSGNRVKIPRDGFLYYCRYGKKEVPPQP